MLDESSALVVSTDSTPLLTSQASPDHSTLKRSTLVSVVIIPGWQL